MAVREIRIFGDPVLKTKCAPVVNFDAKLQAIVTDLLDTVKLPGRAGVAANQIGIPLRIFSYLVDDKVGYLINPEIVELSGEPVLMQEGCLSVPDLWFETLRYPQSTAIGYDLSGKKVTVTGTGVLAQALQHECDHLDGLLYLDRLSKAVRGQAFKAIRESGWF